MSLRIYMRPYLCLFHLISSSLHRTEEKLAEVTSCVTRKNVRDFRAAGSEAYFIHALTNNQISGLNYVGDVGKLWLATLMDHF
jgi:hypothetical protein